MRVSARRASRARGRSARRLQDYRAATTLPDGEQGTALFLSDLTHPNPAGYVALTKTLPRILKEELKP